MSAEIPVRNAADFANDGVESTAVARELDILDVAGVPITLINMAENLDLIMERASGASASELPLAVVSVNLDHVFHFGRGGRWDGTLHANPETSAIQWLYTIDGAPVVSRVKRMTGAQWPRLAGSDLAKPILKRAEAEGRSVAFVGGSAETQVSLKQQLALEFPNLIVSGMWAPERKTLESTEASERLALEIADSHADIVFVGFGKPRQELWIGRYGLLTKAPVLLAFGAVVDFLAGRVRRAPKVIAENGLEWAWRLSLEPKRLGSRYLVQGPEAYRRLQSRLAPKALPGIHPPVHVLEHDPTRPEHFAGPDATVSIDVIVITYNNRDHIDALIAGLRAELSSVSLRVHLVDNCSQDGTLEWVLEHYPDVNAFSSGGNLGYAAAINQAIDQTGNCSGILILNPDLVVEPGSISALLKRMKVSGAGVVVPQLLDTEGHISQSIFHEPTLLNALGDALMGDRLPNRPVHLSGFDRGTEAYQHPHTIHAATGAALLIRSDVAREIPWNESYFLYSEEIEFFREVSKRNQSVWYEPAAKMVHVGGGSASSAALDALLSVNRVKYIRKFHGAAYARVFRGVLILDAALRSRKANQRFVFKTLIDVDSWSRLPNSSRAVVLPEELRCSIVIPAHNESKVIGRLLEGLKPLTALDGVEVIVSCNGCTDNTADIALSYQGVRVVENEQASKIVALNAADAVATAWPRFYVDADVEITPAAIRDVVSSLEKTGALASRPAVSYESGKADYFVRSFYRVRSQMNSVRTALWSGGVYALSEEGRKRFDQFPDVVADDLFVDSLFSRNELTFPQTDPVVFRTPRTIASQLNVLQRVNRGNSEHVAKHGQQPTLRKTARELLQTVRGPRSAVDAIIYTTVVSLGRLRRKAGESEWNRDETSRGESS